MPTTRLTPVGRMLEDGYQTLITFQADPDVSLWEKTVKPPGVNGGDPIEQTTMWNVTYRTFAFRALKTITEATLTCAYDPRVLLQAVALANVNTLITVRYSDLSTVDFWGALITFEPNDAGEGTQPEASVNITPSNLNASGVETAPNYISPTGTDI